MSSTDSFPIEFILLVILGVCIMFVAVAGALLVMRIIDQQYEIDRLKEKIEHIEYQEAFAEEWRE